MRDLPPSGEWAIQCVSLMQRLKNWQNKPSIAKSHRERNEASRERDIFKGDGYLRFMMGLGRFTFEEGLLVFLLCG